MDYSKLSDSDLMALYNNDYSKLSDEGLKYLYNDTPQAEKPKSAYDGILDDNTLSKEEKVKRIQEVSKAEQQRISKEDLLNKARIGLGGALEGASYHPIFNIPVVGTPIGGAMSGAGNAIMEGKSGKEILKEAGQGAAIATSLSAIPYANKLRKPVGDLASLAFKHSFPGLKAKTVEQLIKPNSKALDLTEETAQNLLMNTTERIQKDYRNLLNKAGENVNLASLRLPEDRGVFASSLKNSLNDIYGGHSVSGVEGLNPAYDVAGDIYQDLINKIDIASDVKDIGKVSAPKLADIMGTVKNYPINWQTSNAKDRQALLKQIYGDFSRRLGNLSPELRKANKEYAKLAKFDDNEGLKQIINPSVMDANKIDSASTALRNYNSTVTKGNTNRNIQDLEKLLVSKGKKPFLNDIDDVNAANELLKTAETGINPFGLTDKLKNIVERPILLGARKYNQVLSPKFNTMNSFIDKVAPDVVKVLTPAVVQGILRD